MKRYKRRMSDSSNYKYTVPYASSSTLVQIQVTFLNNIRYSLQLWLSTLLNIMLFLVDKFVSTGNHTLEYLNHLLYTGQTTFSTSQFLRSFSIPSWTFSMTLFRSMAESSQFKSISSSSMTVPGEYRDAGVIGNARRVRWVDSQYISLQARNEHQDPQSCPRNTRQEHC